MKNGQGQLAAKLAQKEKEIALLSKIADSVAYNLDIEKVLNEIIDIVHELTQGDSIFLYVFEEDEGKLVLRASKNPHRNLLGKISLKLGEGITGWAAEHKQTVEISEKASGDPRFKLFNNIPEDQFEAFLSIPITFRGKLIGVVNIQHRQTKKLPEDTIDLLSIIAKQVGGAIENARLVEQSQALKEALETRKTVDHAKGLLIKKGYSEPEAYTHLQKLAMKNRKSLKDVAEAIIMLFGGK